MSQPEEPIIVHVSPKIDETCDHEWHYEEVEGQEEPSHCIKCGLSWTRYIFCCAP